MDLLRHGDLVAIAATARKVSAEEMRPGIELLESWGLRVRVPERLYSSDHQFAGTDAHRSEQMQALLDDPNVKAIFCARGGYGSVRMADALNFDYFVEHSKWIIGYSDVTVLHAHLYQHMAYRSIHGPMMLNFQPEKLHKESAEHLRKTLFEGPQSLSFASHPRNKTEGMPVSGTLVGGNLSVLYSILGSASEPDYTDKILFLEDLDEYLYHIDRMMLALRRSGRLAHLAALVVGDMSDMKDNAVPFGKTAYEIILDAVKDYSFPVVFGAPFGHEPRNLSLVHGARYRLEQGSMIQLIPEG